MEIKNVMDREKVANSIHKILETGIDLISKEKLTQDDHAKIKVIRTMGTHVNAAISMIQQETAQLRALIVIERMKQLGYNTPKYLE